MSRRGGIQAGTAAMHDRLDDLAREWRSIGELAWALSDEFGRPYLYAREIVRKWLLYRAGSVLVEKAGRTKFVCSRLNASLSVDALEERYWGELPDQFRRDRRRMRGLPPDERVFGILMAYGWLAHKEPSCRRAFNRWAKPLGIAQIPGEL